MNFLNEIALPFFFYLFPNNTHALYSSHSEIIAKGKKY